MNQEKEYFIKDKLMWWESVWSPYCDRLFRLADFQSGDLVLEIGGGDGRFAFPIVFIGCTYVDVDLSKEMILKIKSRLKSENKNVQNSFTFILADGANLPLRNKIFDRAICYCTIMHIPNQQNVICEMARVTKPNSIFLVDFHPASIRAFMGSLIKRLLRIPFFNKVTRYLLRRDIGPIPFHPTTLRRAISYFRKANATIIEKSSNYVSIVIKAIPRS